MVKAGIHTGIDLQMEDRRVTMTTKWLVSEKGVLEIAAWARLDSGALKREANSAFWASEIERASPFLLLIAHIEQQAQNRSVAGTS
jgi:hypothetical protein